MHAHASHVPAAMLRHRPFGPMAPAFGLRGHEFTKKITEREVEVHRKAAQNARTRDIPQRKPTKKPPKEAKRTKITPKQRKIQCNLQIINR